MLVNSRGIVLSTVRYSDSSVIARIFTEAAGLRPFMVRVGKGRGAAGRMSVLQPISPVMLTFDPEQRQGIRTPRTLEREMVLTCIPFDAMRSSVAMFLAEVLGRSLQEDLQDAGLFDLIHSTVMMLDDEHGDFINLHLVFMMELTRHLGCRPQLDPECELPYFDLREGEYCAMPPLHPHHLSDGPLRDFTSLAECSLNHQKPLRLTNTGRRQLLRAMIDYLRLHVDGMGEVRSCAVLEEVLG